MLGLQAHLSRDGFGEAHPASSFLLRNPILSGLNATFDYSRYAILLPLALAKSGKIINALCGKVDFIRTLLFANQTLRCAQGERVLNTCA